MSRIYEKDRGRGGMASSSYGHREVLRNGSRETDNGLRLLPAFRQVRKRRETGPYNATHGLEPPLLQLGPHLLFFSLSLSLQTEKLRKNHNGDEVTRER